jgi:hypothetical protein
VAEAGRRTHSAVLELEPASVLVKPRRLTWLIGVVAVTAIVGAAVALAGSGGSSDGRASADARIAAFHAAMVQERSFAYELDLIAEDVAGDEIIDAVPGGPLDLFQIDGRVAAEDRFAMEVTLAEGVQEVVRVGDDLFQRGVSVGDGETWMRGDHHDLEALSLEDVRDGLEPDDGMDAADARLMTIARVYLERVIIDPAELPRLLASVEPDATEGSPSSSTADALADVDGEVATMGVVSFPSTYEELLPDVAPMAVTVQLGPGGDPTAARLEVSADGGAITAALRFSDWGGDIEVVAPEGAESAEEVFEEVGTAIEDPAPADAQPGGEDDPLVDDPTAPRPGELDPAMSVWVPTALPAGFELVDLQPADASGDDGCNGVFAIWMGSGRPAADWVSQDAPESGNSQLLTVTSVPVGCHFVQRTPFFEPGPFGDVPSRRIGDRFEVLLDDAWVVGLDTVVATWDELVAMVRSLDIVRLSSLQDQLR